MPLKTAIDKGFSDIKSRLLGSDMLSDRVWSEIARSLNLSARELQITRGIFDNLTERAIAANLRISENTVHSHLNRLFKKIRITTRVQVVLRIMDELLSLTISQTGSLPPICRNRAHGRCPMQTPIADSAVLGYSAVTQIADFRDRVD